MNNVVEIVSKRLGVLRLAKKLGNVAEACRQFGISRTTYYKYKHRYEIRGIAGLYNLSPLPKTRPRSTSPKVVRKILLTSDRHPVWGCVLIRKHLYSKYIIISTKTIQKILKQHGRGTRAERLDRHKKCQQGLVTKIYHEDIV